MYKKYISLDVGDVRIGVARSDLLGIVATPLEVINRKKVKSVKRIEELLKENNTKSLVVGIPKSLDGTEKRQAEKVIWITHLLFLLFLINHIPCYFRVQGQWKLKGFKYGRYF